MRPAKRILLVEDNALIRGAMRYLLEAAGFRVTCAANGWEALDRLRQGERPLVILLDLAMPILDGWAFRQQQRCAPALASIPVVLLSAEPDLPQIAASLGAAAYFSKPVDFEELLKVIVALDEGRSAHAHAG